MMVGLSLSLVVGLLVLLVLAELTFVVDGKKMWGSRRKREDAEELVFPAPASARAQTSANKNKKSAVADRGRSSNRRGSIKSNMHVLEDDSFDVAKLEETLNLYLNSFEELMDSEDFDSMVNPDSIKNMMLQFPGAANVPELQSLFNMAEFSDPILLKATMREGLTLAKKSTREIVALLSDPEKMEELAGQFPPEVKTVIDALRTGDFTALKNFVVNLPGLDASQRRLLLSLLDGNTDILLSELQKAMGDELQLEALRLQLLDSPQLAEAMGLRKEILQDPERWAEAAAESTNSLLSQMKAAEGEDLDGREPSAGSRPRSHGQAMHNHQAAAMRELLKSFSQNQEDREVWAADGGDSGVPISRKRRFAGRAA